MLTRTYNQATSNLAIYSHETSQDISCQKHKIDSLLLSSSCMTNYMKSCSFLHAHFFELIEVVENLFKKKLMVKNSFIENTYVVGTHWDYLIEEAIPICTYNICC